MDPDRTLITFLLQTDPTVHSVQLIGSWDNFATWYTMKHDARRGRGQWRGCYSFKNIVDRNEHGTTGQPPKRSGGLKMGRTYYYYYEIDGSTEIHDPAQPSTNTCPYLPGQTVNTLVVPLEQTLRQRSASTSSMHVESFMTMDPETRFESPTPAPVPAQSRSLRRLGSASSLVQNRPFGRPGSSSPSWKRFFSRKLAAWDQELHCTSADSRTSTPSSATEKEEFDSRPQTSAGSRRNRDISPSSLRRRLMQDIEPHSERTSAELLVSAMIPEDAASQHAVEEDEDDEDDFAATEDHEAQTYGTTLSPPPFSRSTSSETVSRAVANSSTITLTINTAASRKNQQSPPSETASISAVPQNDSIHSNVSRSYWSPTTSASSVFETPTSPHSLADESNSFYESNEDDEDDGFSSIDGENRSYLTSGTEAKDNEAFVGYSLPRHGEEGKEMQSHSPRISSLHSPPLVPRTGSEVPLTKNNLLGTSLDMGLDDFASELGTMVSLIGNINR